MTEIVAGPCEFCTKVGKRISGPEEGLQKPVFTCDGCLRILKDPRRGLQLIRGHLTVQQRGQGDPKAVKDRLDKFMEMVSKWRPRD